MRASIFSAEEVFNRRWLWILLSKLDKSQEQSFVGIKVSCCASGMSVVIVGAEHSRWIFFAMWIFVAFWL